MSYCRRITPGSDLYIFWSGPYWICQDCPFCERPTWEFLAKTPAQMLAHLDAHQAAAERGEVGHRFPPYVRERLKAEQRAIWPIVEARWDRVRGAWWNWRHRRGWV